MQRLARGVGARPADPVGLLQRGLATLIHRGSVSGAFSKFYLLREDFDV
jgi:hypothetical protein